MAELQKILAKQDKYDLEISLSRGKYRKLENDLQEEIQYLSDDNRALRGKILESALPNWDNCKLDEIPRWVKREIMERFLLYAPDDSELMKQLVKTIKKSILNHIYYVIKNPNERVYNYAINQQAMKLIQQTLKKYRV